MNVHAFLLVLLLGDVQQGGQPMYFRDVERCNYFAGKLQKHRFLYGGSRKIQAHCIPESVNPKTTKILR